VFTQRSSAKSTRRHVPFTRYVDVMADSRRVAAGMSVWSDLSRLHLRLRLRLRLLVLRSRPLRSSPASAESGQRIGQLGNDGPRGASERLTASAGGISDKLR